MNNVLNDTTWNTDYFWRVRTGLIFKKCTLNCLGMKCYDICNLVFDRLWTELFAHKKFVCETLTPVPENVTILEIGPLKANLS